MPLRFAWDRRAALSVGLCLGCTFACRTPLSARAAPAPVPIPLARFHADSSAYTHYSGIADSLRLVVHDEARWRETWRRIHSAMTPQPPVPPVDFSRQMVIVAALGRRPTAGYDVFIVSAALDSEGIEVVVERSVPGRGCIAAATITHPVDLAKITASNRPIRFVERIITAPCGVR